MHIKTLTIQGFKSYRDSTPLEAFSPGLNVVVGRNGSGKSNFFSAIRFVLSDAYTSMSREDRQALLHEGTSTATTLSAFVEIVFANDDGRFPTGRDEVVLRRTIGLKKDEYSVDRKSSSKAEVMNLLESAGFSRSNPYYIVPQGRITFLTNAKDKERLDLLKEVAGTTLYDEKKAESLKTLNAAEIRRAKMTSTLENVDGRLRDLEEEMTELREFQEKERERKALEYAMYEGELEEITGTLGDMEAERNQTMNSSNQRRREFVAREKHITELETALSEHRQQLELLAVSTTSSQEEMHDLIRSLTELECLVADLTSSTESTAGRQEALEGEVATIERRIEVVRAELDGEVQPAWRTAVAEERAVRQELDGESARVDALYAKQARHGQFSTRADRDTFLAAQASTLESRMTEAAQKAAALGARADDSHKRLADVQAESRSLRTAVEGTQADERAIADELREAKDKEGRLSDQRKDLWREDAKVESTAHHAREELKGAERHLATTMDRDTASGLKALDRIVDRLGLAGVHGPLYKLFTVSEKYSLAVEETAGTSLFHIVVDTDATASRLVEVMNAERLGRLTFVPLNRVRATPHTYPQSDEVIPLIRKLQFDALHAPAFEQVFGSTIVADDLHVATAYRRSHGLNVITLEGDRADRKGSLTGGYHDLRRSRLEGIKTERTWRTKHEADAARLAEVRRSISRVDQELTRTIGQVQVLDARRKQARLRRETLLAELAEAQAEEDRLKGALERLEKDKEEAEGEVATLRVKIDAVQAEMATGMESALSDEEERLLRDLAAEVKRLQGQLTVKTKDRTELTERKNALEIELFESLIRKRDGFRAQIESLNLPATGATQTADDIDARKREVASLKKAVDDLKEQIKANEERKDELETEIQTTNDELERIKAEQQEDGRGIARSQKVVERYISKRQTLLERKDECTKLIRDLGVLPEDAFEKYKDLDSTRLLKRLHKVKTALGKFSHVNKKALQMYEKYSAQRDDIYARFTEMEKSSESIHELIRNLDKKKDAAIENTFGEVSKHFGEIFEKLVPAGRGRLVMNKRADNADLDDDAMDEDDERSKIDSYTGVSIKVSFNSKSDEGLRIQQLSGGQKALVALALVFSIQRCDPAPFYLFDEIDANLDAQYRTSVAGMIAELSDNAQFITTTFRPELIATCDKAYGVVFSNEKVSTLKTITKDQAMQFVDHTLTEGA